MCEPMRIAQILNRMDSGGIEAVVMNYYRHIDRTRVQFDFYFAQDSTFPQRDELERLGAGIYPIPPYTQVIAYHKALYKAFKERRYQIVHAHLSTMSVFPLFAAWRAGAPVRICHNHSTAHWGEGKKTLLKYLLRPFAKVFATDYFACGEMAGRWMYGDRSFDKGKVYIMKNAIDTKRFAYDSEIRACLRKELGIPQECFVIGHVGRLTYAKNQSFLLKVFCHFLQQRPNSCLLLVGEGELKKDIEQKVHGLELEDKVVLTGARRDADKLYSVMDVFCLPSFYEGFAVVALEAQASGLRCVCSDKVSHEIDLSEKVCHLPLQTRGATHWCERLQAECGANGRVAPERIKKFDIFCAAKRIQQFYMDRSFYENDLSHP